MKVMYKALNYFQRKLASNKKKTPCQGIHCHRSFLHTANYYSEILSDLTTLINSMTNMFFGMFGTENSKSFNEIDKLRFGKKKKKKKLTFPLLPP